MRPLAEIALSRAATDAARRGHPWIWNTGVLRGRGRAGAELSGVAPGDVVQLVGEDGAPLGCAIADPESPIAMRLWTTGRAPIDAALFASRVDRALRLRDAFVGEGTTAYRLLNGEGDRCPGFVVDRYADVAVVRVDGAGASAWVDRFADALWSALEPRGVRSLIHRPQGARRDGGAADRAAKREVAVLRGTPPPDTIDVSEHGVPFVVDLHGQKTGAFLDQRENRRRVGELARGRRVLNLFSYAGGFSLRAALGGATRVTSVDIAAKAHATAQASFRLAGVDARAHDFVTADAFAFLADASAKKKTWDLVVSDPPSFAPSEKTKPRALSAYRALHRACADVLADGGIFCASSCSSHVDAATFAATLDDTGLCLLETHGAPADHPTLPAWPEGRYLKFFVLG